MFEIRPLSVLDDSGIVAVSIFTPAAPRSDVSPSVKRAGVEMG
jgi:hypothetical protein